MRWVWGKRSSAASSASELIRRGRGKADPGGHHQKSMLVQFQKEFLDPLLHPAGAAGFGAFSASASTFHQRKNRFHY